mmetsp:Transcript_99926/g.282105  ORF Transcript_99926/g.282105 Transcript_99926/m.282105 type:complete len:200 (-) Transcript_99926:575-1174(-)
MGDTIFVSVASLCEIQPRAVGHELHRTAARELHPLSVTSESLFQQFPVLPDNHATLFAEQSLLQGFPDVELVIAKIEPLEQLFYGILRTILLLVVVKTCEGDPGDGFQELKARKTLIRHDGERLQGLIVLVEHIGADEYPVAIRMNEVRGVNGRASVNQFISRFFRFDRTPRLGVGCWSDFHVGILGIRDSHGLRSLDP